MDAGLSWQHHLLALRSGPGGFAANKKAHWSTKPLDAPSSVQTLHTTPIFESHGQSISSQTTSYFTNWHRISHFQRPIRLGESLSSTTFFSRERKRDCKSALKP